MTGRIIDNFESRQPKDNSDQLQLKLTEIISEEKIVF
jgi:hypothetical protein